MISFVPCLKIPWPRQVELDLRHHIVPGVEDGRDDEVCCIMCCCAGCGGECGGCGDVVGVACEFGLADDVDEADLCGDLSVIIVPVIITIIIIIILGNKINNECCELCFFKTTRLGGDITIDKTRCDVNMSCGIA